MAITTVRARPATDAGGTIGVTVPAIARGDKASTRLLSDRALSASAHLMLMSTMDHEVPVLKNEARGCELLDELMIVGSDDHRGSEPVEFDKQT